MIYFCIKIKSKKIPECVLRMTNLKILELFYNKIKEIPTNIQISNNLNVYI